MGYCTGKGKAMTKATTSALRLNSINPRYQSGILTTFTGVLILVLLTLMMFFAIRVGVFEQRVSSNDMRQKDAFHAAESGIQHAKEFFRETKVNALIATDKEDFLPNGDDGWLADTSEKRWKSCDPDDGEWSTSDQSHPCYGEPSSDRRSTMFFYEFPDASGSASTRLPIDTDTILNDPTEDVDVYALLCVLNVDATMDPPVQGCGQTAADMNDPDTFGDYFMVTLLARGQSDCDGGACKGEALVSEQISNFGAAAGGNTPAVPLTTKSSFPPSGSAEIVPNPNAGGVGVPVSVWMNGRGPDSLCPQQAAPIDPTSGSWATCEAHEWYGVDAMPDNFACPPTTTCSCSETESISYTKGTSDILGIDLIQDTNFPCDLFQFYFGVPRTEYETVKGYSQVINDCSTLGPNSFGIYWVTGPACRIAANTTVGSPDAPVLLISAATLTRLNGGAKIYGTVFITDVEDGNAELQSIGTNTVYGQVLVDGTLGSYSGTFQVVYNDLTARKAGTGGGLGTVIGGWTDNPGQWSFE
jgi:hypothetical protein